MRFLSTLAASVLGTLVAFGLVFLLLFFFVFAISLSGDPTPRVTPGSVLVVPVDGTVPEQAPDDPFLQAFSDGPTYDLLDMHSAMEKAASDDRIEAVWLRLKTVSASWGTLEEVRSAVSRFRESGKLVIASSEDFGMSEKAYYLATAADSVFTGPVSMFNYNGFAFQPAFFAGSLDKLGIEPKVVRAGQFKSAVEPFTRSTLSDENRLQLSALLETQNDVFKQDVAARRGMTPEALEQMADEDPIMQSETAAERGLIDGLKHYDEVLDVFRKTLGLETSAGVPTIEITQYARVPASEAGISYAGGGEVAVIYATGQIVSGESDQPVGGDASQIGSTTLVQALRQARSSSSVRAVVLRVNSPGGSASASEAMWREVTRTTEEKPVIVSMGGSAASGGYYIAAAADTIVANRTTITGSIGVFGLLFDASELLEDRLGVTFDEILTSEYADIYSSTEPFSEGERRLFAGFVDNTYQTFLQRVADGRGMDVSAVNDIAQGRVWSGRDAATVGLVDTLGTLYDAVRLAGRRAGLDGPVPVRILPRPKSFIERFNERLSGQAAQIWQSMGRSPLEERLLQEARYLQQILGTHGTVQARLPVRIEIE